jgi:hypothetical protein
LNKLHYDAETKEYTEDYEGINVKKLQNDKTVAKSIEEKPTAKFLKQRENRLNLNELPPEEKI